MVEFAEKIQKNFKNLQIPNLSTRHWLNSRKTKIIE